MSLFGGMFGKMKEKALPPWKNKDGTIECHENLCPHGCESDCPIHECTIAAGLMSLKQYDKAIEIYRECTQTAPAFYDAWNNLAVAYGSNGKYLNAYKCYLKAHDLKPERPAPIYGLALASRDLKRHEESLMWCDLYVKMCGNDERVDSARKNVLSSLENHSKVKYDKAIDSLETQNEEVIKCAISTIEELATRYEYAPAMLWMGDMAENALHDYAKACTWYKKAAERGDGNGARNYADMLMTGRGVEQSTQDALKYYALAAEAGIPEASFVIGGYERNAGRKKEALVAYQRALKNGYEPAQTRITQMEQDVNFLDLGFVEGSAVKHPKYGNGTIVEFVGKNKRMARVKFGDTTALVEINDFLGLEND